MIMIEDNNIYGTLFFKSENYNSESSLNKIKNNLVFISALKSSIILHKI